MTGISVIELPSTKAIRFQNDEYYQLRGERWIKRKPTASTTLWDAYDARPLTADGEGLIFQTADGMHWYYSWGKTPLKLARYIRLGRLGDDAVVLKPRRHWGALGDY